MMKTKEFLSYYKTEINLLREVGKEYSKKQPLVASYLAETSKDPDTERLIEATAFLNANLKKELDDSYDIFSYELIDIIYPDVVKSKPSVSIMQIRPNLDLSERLLVKEGSYFKSKKTHNIACKFKSTWDMDVYPIALANTEFSENLDGSSWLKLDFTSSMNVDSLEMDTLDFFINMPLPNSYTLARMLMNNLQRIIVQYDQEQMSIDVACLENLGFQEGYNLFSYNKKTLERFKFLNEYFSFSRKNLFFRLQGMLKYFSVMSTASFSMTFHFNVSDSHLVHIKEEGLLLYCVPIANIFEFDTEPIKVNYMNEDVKVVTSFNDEDHYLLYEINQVRGLKSSKPKKNTYLPFNDFNDGEYVYKFFRKKALGDFRKEEGYLQLFYKNDENLDDIITVNANVTNGALCETLQIGDIHLGSENSPEYCEFSNVIIPSTYVESPIENKKLTFIISHISTNIFGIDDIEDFKRILRFYVADYSRDKENNKINLKKIDSLKQMSIQNSNRLHNGMMIHGKAVELSLDSSDFVNISDMYLFCKAIFIFFKYSMAINSFITLAVLDTYSGERFDFS